MAKLDFPSPTPFVLFVFLLFSLDFARPIVGSGGEGGEGKEEAFTEELLLKPLPDKKVLAHFHFRSFAPPSDSIGRHHHLFPKAIAQLVQKFHIRELELSFTQGRWNYDTWGGSDPMSSINAKPPGVELWAAFDLQTDDIDTTWEGLTHALSGIFCSSINFLESSAAYAAPIWGLRANTSDIRPSWGLHANTSDIRYGALPREAVCTENLTPWLKLLPCRDKAGLAYLLDRPSIYKGHYHSQKLCLFSSGSTGMILDQTLTLVLRPNIQKTGVSNAYDRSLQPNWSISSMFKKKITGQCVLAKASTVFVELENSLVTKLEKLGPRESWNTSIFDLLATPDRVIKETSFVDGQSNSILYEFKVVNYNKYEPLDVGLKWKLPLVWSCPQAPFRASRFLMGSGNERGSIAISLDATQEHEWFSSNLQECTAQVVVFQVVPWYVKVYYHTIQIFVDGKPLEFTDVIEKIRVSPSEDKVSPGTMEMKLRLPCSMRSAALTVDFDKGFLHIDEYPPDANQGFDVPSAIISFPDFYSTRDYLDGNPLGHSPLLLKLQEKTVLQSYTEVLLVPLTTPDFSMPYNVITFTCTVLALYFGSLLNALRRRIGEEERLSKSKADSKRLGLIPKLLLRWKGQSHSSQSSPSSSSSILGPKRLTKVIIVAILAIIWHYYFNTD